jgi:enamine deaminase RidA (YjgF/YER057c/UK114 family)
VSQLSHPRPDGVAPGKGYSHVVTATGRWVAVAGQVAFDEAGQVVGAGDPAAQARQVFAKVPASRGSGGG